MQNKPVTDWGDVPVVVDLPMAARVLAFSPEYLKQLSQRGKFPAFKAGNSWRVSKTALKKYCGEV